MKLEPLAFLFPGQGAQVLGMGVDLAGAFPEALAVFNAGKEILGRDILEICANGPEEELNSTRTSQPAIFLNSMAVLEVLRARWKLAERFCGGKQAGGIAALATAGLSLGEYSALVFARSLEFEDALRIVGRRGEYMQEACDAAKGTMASVIGLKAARVEEIIQEAQAEGLRVGVANYNSPDQTVISGEVGAVDEASKRLAAAGARRAIRLKVAGAYHSALMAPAARKLEPHLRAVAIRPPCIPFLGNVAGKEVADPEAIRRGLMSQVENSVRWEQSMRALLARKVSHALEVGPGRVLQGLLKSLQKEAGLAVDVVPLGSLSDLDRFVQGSAGEGLHADVAAPVGSGEKAGGGQGGEVA